MGTLLSLAVATTALLGGTFIGFVVGGSVTACACRTGRASGPRDLEPKPGDQSEAQSNASPRQPTRASRDQARRQRRKKSG